MTTEVGPVPRIKTKLDIRDRISTALVRCGINRYRYTIAPGLYGVGDPDKTSEVLVTANFKLTFDHLRRELATLNAWILVLDTKGVNVWCAASKGTFSSRELTNHILKADLDKIVDHKRVIVPQLGATGICAKAVKKESGFRVVYGPIRAADIIKFLENKRKADSSMRAVTFTFLERIILTPVELQIVLKPALITAIVLFILSGMGPGFFSFSGAWNRGAIAFITLAIGMVSGAVITPALLPYIPGRQFALKGFITGSLAALIMAGLIPAATASPSTGLALFLFCVTISSFLAMNFTGTTPFTSPSGVEKEMKRYIPIQLTTLVLSTGLWIYSAF
ncbi:MAG: hypothetical protein GY710_04645 [Desulfobacteraceae bacterium]|nr:hypothetical protein [Desulfobacteraceae bacterium]